MRIKIFSSFSTSEQCKKVYEKIFETHLLSNYGKDEDVYITTENDYTHAFILNTATPNLLPTVSPSNVIGFAFEPPLFLGITKSFVEYAKKHIGKYYIGDVYNLPSPFTAHYGYMWHITPYKTIPLYREKPNMMSIVVSNKMNAPGHKYRHQLVERILKTDLPVHIYGIGTLEYHRKLKDPRIKGMFKEREPYETYRFHICTENFQTDHYFSEKYTNPLLSNCRPIYLGCKNIDSYFPNYTIHLSGDAEKDIHILSDVFKYPNKYFKFLDEEEMQDMKNRINPMKHLDEFFSVDSDKK
jgi:hypothetical protein